MRKPLLTNSFEAASEKWLGTPNLAAQMHITGTTKEAAGFHDHLSTRLLSTFPNDTFQLAERRLATPFLFSLHLASFLGGPRNGALF